MALNRSARTIGETLAKDQSPRAEITSVVNALNVAVSLTVLYVWPGVPKDLLVAWLGVFAILVRWLEQIYDRRHGN